jgi:hypothetical protein
MLILGSCGSKEVRYSGLNDLFIGVQQIVLYEDGTFYFELSGANAEGKFELHKDTILLRYDKRPFDNWPQRMIMNDDCFVALDGEEIKISRSQ